jgi:preprotein translocase SecE subunit
VARNRKRAKERRSRGPQAAAPSRPRLATARPDGHEDRLAQPDRAGGAPEPIEHAAPDVELAEAQLALGRPGLTDEDEGDPELGAPVEAERALVEEAEAEPAPAPLPAARAPEGNRLVNFLQGSWRELQRVQWPDRRQVMQATGVVVGFVIVAGAFLGVADWLASRIVDFLIK